MKRIAFWLIALATLAGVLVCTAPASGYVDDASSPIYGVKFRTGTVTGS